MPARSPPACQHHPAADLAAVVTDLVPIVVVDPVGDDLVVDDLNFGHILFQQTFHSPANSLDVE